MEMTRINSCEVTDCAYNKHKSCHTLAITVGGPMEGPHCDTFFTTSMEGGIPDTRGGVGACKMANCAHNEALECRADSITVGWQQKNPDCKTFQRK
ncbi:DUF1540 domain-containing protein [Pelotalea chapellei]|uniref:DUF1540 domain-containing protein n=1 Tax=Pelotalea chapellei TaxID=44671 RepID=A0ABS5U9U7_9BACT|nr:DUF1540 domain-containing protein [Pelotalea chapellei]MBT1072444.1 DUF1540 domain-containing protein [Pelotalea chapellei]